MTKLLLALIRLYQLTLSPLLGNACRFTPSCSRYTAACIASHGPVRGTWLGLRRVLRCHPFHAGGYDPPPPPSHAPDSAHPETSEATPPFGSSLPPLMSFHVAPRSCDSITLPLACTRSFAPS